MASSGSFNSSAYAVSDGSRYLTFSWSVKSQNTTANTTTISWSLKGGGTSTKWVMSGNFKVVIAGQTVYSTGEYDRIKLSNGTAVASGTFTFTHESDGTKSFTVSIQGGIYTVAVNCTGSKTFTLNTIARASQPSCVTWPDHTQQVGEFGDTISIHMNRKNSAFTHTVRYKYGTLEGTIATNVATGTTWTIPLSFMDLIPASTSGSGTIYVDTYSGTTLIGTKYCGFTATVPTSVKPSCSLTLEDVTGIDEIYGSPVKGLSKIKITVPVTTAYSSPIDSCEISVNGVKYFGTEATTNALTTAGLNPVIVRVTDKRGRMASLTYGMDVLDYSAPAITSLNVMRCNSDGVTNKRGDHIKVTFSASVSPMSDQNTATYSLQYKKTSESNYSTHELSELANEYEPTSFAYVFAANTGNSYDIVLLATDRHASSTKSTKAASAASIFSWRGFRGSSGVDDGAGIGKVPEKPNCLQVGWNTEFDKDVVHLGNQYTFSSSGAAGSIGYIRMAQITHKEATFDTPITFVFSQRLKSQPMTVHVLFESDSSTLEPTLNCITYEGANYGAFLVHSAESVWDLYVQKGSSDDVVTLQTWFSSAKVSDGLLITFPGDHVSTLPQGLEGYYRATPAEMQSLLDYIYPVGSIYLSYSHVSPASLFGGTWERIENRFLWATTETGSIGGTGGASTVTLKTANLPSHNHQGLYYFTNPDTASYGITLNGGSSSYKMSWTARGTGSGSTEIVTGKTGSGTAFNILPPYIQISAWRRTA